MVFLDSDWGCCVLQNILSQLVLQKSDMLLNLWPTVHGEYIRGVHAFECSYVHRCPCPSHVHMCAQSCVYAYISGTVFYTLSRHPNVLSPQTTFEPCAANILTKIIYGKKISALCTNCEEAASKKQRAPKKVIFTNSGWNVHHTRSSLWVSTVFTDWDATIYKTVSKNTDYSRHSTYSHCNFKNPGWTIYKTYQETVCQRKTDYNLKSNPPHDNYESLNLNNIFDKFM
jgi:hypothetical protein